MAGDAGIAKQAAGAAVDAVFASIAEALARGEVVSVVRFGKFSRKNRPAREGKNPSTGERIAIGSSASDSFKAGKPLKDSLSSPFSSPKVRRLARTS